MKNGQLSAGKRSKHLDIRFQDLINRSILTVEHCKTEDMIADFLQNLCKVVDSSVFEI
jgi:hypothetical protein